MERRIIAFAICIAFSSLGLKAQSVQVTPLDSSTIADALSNVIFGGCVQISNISYSGAPEAFGHFTDSDSTIGMADGLVMSTGLVATIGDTASDFSTYYNNTPGDTLLQEVSGVFTYDAAVLEFDFIPISDTIFASQFVFGSEEYPEYVCSPWNDVFGFFIEGVTTSDTMTNVAVIPGTAIPITINNVNGDPTCGGDYGMYYYETDTTIDSNDVVFDGMTTVFPLYYPVISGETYHMKIALADGSDGSFDSGIFLKTQTFCGNFWFQNAQFLVQNTGGMTYEFENQSFAAQGYLWDFGDGSYSSDANPTHTYAQPGSYEVVLTCTNECQTNEASVTINNGVTGLNEDLTGASLKVFPRTSDELVVQFEDNATHRLSLEILDLSGKVVVTKDLGITSRISLPVDISNLSAGSYVARLSNGQNSLSRKFFR